MSLDKGFNLLLFLLHLASPSLPSAPVLGTLCPFYLLSHTYLDLLSSFEICFTMTTVCL